MNTTQARKRLAAGPDTSEVKPSLRVRAEALAAIKRAKASATPVSKPSTPRDRVGGPVFTVEHGFVALLTKNSWGRVAHAVYMPETIELVEALITIDRHTRSAGAARELVAAHLKAMGAASKDVLSVDAVLESFRKMCARSPGVTKAAIKAGVTMDALVGAWMEENGGITTPWDAKLTTAQLDWVKSTYSR